MKIQLKRSNVIDSGSAKEPTPAQMEYGELAVNYSGTDPALFIKDEADNIVRIAGANSVSGVTPGDGTITIKQPGSPDQSFTVNQSGDTEINLKNDNTEPTVGNGTITIKQPGTSDQTFTVNQTGNSTINLKNDNTVTSPGNGTITITQPGTSDQSFTVNQSGNTTIALRNDNTQVTPGNGKLQIKTSGEGAFATGAFTANTNLTTTLTLPPIRYTDLTNKPSIESGSWVPTFIDDTGITYNGQFGFYKYQGDGGVSLTGRIRWSNGAGNTNQMKIQTPFVTPAGVTACHGSGSWVEGTNGINTAFVLAQFQSESFIQIIEGNVQSGALNGNRLKYSQFASGDIRFSIFLIDAGLV